jgi:SH3-like domain-containing protein
MQLLISSYILQLKIIFKQISKIIFYLFSFLIYFTSNSIGDVYKPKTAINGSGLKIPRMVSLKKSLVFMRSGPSRDYPIKFVFKKKKYPLLIIAEFNNWRQVETFNNITGWIHTQLLSSIKTGLILKTTFLKEYPSSQSQSKAKLLPNLLIKINKCESDWCKVIIVKNDKFVGWVKSDLIWGSTKNNVQ